MATLDISLANPLIEFVKRTYKILIVILVTVLFFFAYNAYLVDHSLVNLRIALNKLDDVKTMADAKKLSGVLDYSLFQEVSSPEIKTASLSKIELAKDILSKSKDISQIEEAKSALREVVAQKEKERPAVLMVLDNLNKMFTSAVTTVPKEKLENDVAALKDKLNTTADKAARQEIYYELANDYTQLARLADARDAYRSVIDLGSETRLAEKAMFNLAWNEKNQGNFDAAIKQFDELSKSSNEEKLAVFSRYQLADTYRKKGDYEKAVETYREVAGNSKDKDLSPMADIQAGYTYLYNLKDYDKAKASFDRSRVLSPDSRTSEHIKTVSMPAIAAQYRREGFKLLSEGYEFSVPQKYKEAIKSFDKALEISSSEGLSYTGKALGYLWLKDSDRALVAARQAVKYSPRYEMASVNLGYIYLQLNMVDESVVEFKRFISLEPNSSRVYYNLGYAYILTSRLEEALTAFERAAKIDPRFYLVFNNEGWCLWQFGQYAKAIDAFEKAVKLSPQFIDALYNLGMIYKTIGKYEEAKVKFETILKIDPAYPAVAEYLKEIEKALYK